MSTCPESVDGIHDPLTDVHGRCLFCRQKIEAALPKYNHPSRHVTSYGTQDPRWIDGPDEADYLDGR